MDADDWVEEWTETLENGVVLRFVVDPSLPRDTMWMLNSKAMWYEEWVVAEEREEDKWDWI
jgi:hypothetical protein